MTINQPKPIHVFCFFIRAINNLSRYFFAIFPNLLSFFSSTKGFHSSKIWCATKTYRYVFSSSVKNTFKGTESHLWLEFAFDKSNLTLGTVSIKVCHLSNHHRWLQTCNQSSGIFQVWHEVTVRFGSMACTSMITDYRMQRRAFKDKGFETISEELDIPVNTVAHISKFKIHGTGAYLPGNGHRINIDDKF